MAAPLKTALLFVKIQLVISGEALLPAPEPSQKMPPPALMELLLVKIQVNSTPRKTTSEN